MSASFGALIIQGALEGLKLMQLPLRWKSSSS
jgi:hypothetical protein